MKYIEEENKSLIALRSNYFTLMIVISSGLAGLFFADIHIVKIIFLSIVGIYFDYIFLLKFLSINKKLEENIERLK